MSLPSVGLLASQILLQSCAAGTIRPPATPPAPTVRVVTYNIFGGNDLERNSSLTRVAALMDSIQADVVFLQEVDRNTRRSGTVDQPAVLAQHSGLTALFGSSMNYGGGEFGNAILTRFPVKEWKVVPLGAPPGADTLPAYEPRTVLHAVVTTTAGDVHLLNTHLDHRGANSPVRNFQVLRLMAYVAEDVPRDATIILGGDLNAFADALEVRALRLSFSDSWLGCGEGPGFTFRSDRPDRRIDHVLLAGARCVSATVIQSALSDHLPVVVDVLLAPPASRR